jgi:hypothetical protein
MIYYGASKIVSRVSLILGPCSMMRLSLDSVKYRISQAFDLVLHVHLSSHAPVANQCLNRLSLCNFNILLHLFGRLVCHFGLTSLRPAFLVGFLCFDFLLLLLDNIIIMLALKHKVKPLHVLFDGGASILALLASISLILHLFAWGVISICQA